MTVSEGQDMQSTSEMQTPDLYTGEPPLQSAYKTWTKVQNDLAYALGANVHRSWTGRLRVSDACPNTVTLIAPSRFVASKIESTYNDTVDRLWKKHDVVIPPRKVIIVGPSLQRKTPSVTPAHSQSQPRGQRSQPQTVVAYAPKPAANTSSRCETEAHSTETIETPCRRFTFENFVVGPSNELAHAVARQITGETSPSYNPVVIHGQNGMGKTHLLYAIKHAVEDTNPSQRVHLISSEQFVNNFVRSVRKGGREEIENFKASLRDVDLLIIDDAHFIADKPGSQEELLHTLVS